MGKVVELRSVSKSFVDTEGQNHPVLVNVSLAIDGGGRALIEGPSGAGKSTLLNILSGLLVPDSGEVSVNGQTISRLSESERDRFRAKNIGYIFQSFNLISPLTIIENLTVPLYLGGLVDTDLRQRAMNLLSDFGLSEHARKYPYQLSVGQRQRAATVRALLLKPTLLLADEPTASLDAISAKAVIDALRNVNQAGTTLLLATHDPALKDLGFDTTLDLGAKEVAE